MTGNTNTDTDTDASTDDTGSVIDDLPGADAAAHAGDKSARYILGLVFLPVIIPAVFLKKLAWGAVRIVPGRTRIFRRLIKAGYRGLHKKTGRSTHAVVNTIYADGKIVPRPASIDSDTGNLETSNDEEWTVDKGLEPVYVGDTPVVTGFADHHELVDHVGARIAESVDRSAQRYQEVEQKGAEATPVTADEAAANFTTNGQDGAVADGAGVRFLPEYSTTFDDIWVDTSNPEPDNDGWIVSMKKAYELHWSQAGSEEMEQQEIRGILSAKDPTGDTKKALMYVALFGGGIALGMFGPSVAASIGGEAASGISDSVPVMLDLVSWWR